MPVPTSRAPSFQWHDLEVDFARHEARFKGRRMDLTPTEYKLLYHLVRNQGHVLQHATLLAKVWGREYVDEVDYLRVYIRRLRDKLGDDPKSPRYISTERGLGYRFIGPADSPSATHRPAGRRDPTPDIVRSMAGQRSAAGRALAGPSRLIARRGQLQHELVAQRRHDEIPDQLLLLEHPAVLTLGRQSDPTHIRAAPTSSSGAASRSSASSAAARSPITARASWSPIRSSSSRPRHPAAAVRARAGAVDDRHLPRRSASSAGRRDSATRRVVRRGHAISRASWAPSACASKAASATTASRSTSRPIWRTSS